MARHWDTVRDAMSISVSCHGQYEMEVTIMKKPKQKKRCYPSIRKKRETDENIK
jgi:hypothetical protein